MGTDLIYGHEITLEEAYRLNEKYGFEFVVEGGEIKDVLHSGLFR